MIINFDLIFKKYTGLYPNLNPSGAKYQPSAPSLSEVNKPSHTSTNTKPKSSATSGDLSWGNIFSRSSSNKNKSGGSSGRSSGSFGSGRRGGSFGGGRSRG